MIFRLLKEFDSTNGTIINNNNNKYQRKFWEKNMVQDRGNFWNQLNTFAERWMRVRGVQPTTKAHTQIQYDEQANSSIV